MFIHVIQLNPLRKVQATVSEAPHEMLDLRLLLYDWRRGGKSDDMIRVIQKAIYDWYAAGSKATNLPAEPAPDDPTSSRFDRIAQGLDHDAPTT